MRGHGFRRVGRARAGAAVVGIVAALLTSVTALSPLTGMPGASASETTDDGGTSFTYAVTPPASWADHGSATPADAEFVLNGTTGRLFAYVRGTVGWWSFILEAPRGAQLRPGVYHDTDRSATPTTAGLDVSGPWSNCYGGKGTLTVLAVTSDATGRLVSLDAVFDQVCGEHAFHARLRHGAPARAAVVLTPAVTSSVEGQPVALSAVIDDGAADAGGTVTFLDGGSVVGTAPVVGGFASLTTSSLVLGPHELAAAYSGDAARPASTSAPAAVAVASGTTSLWLESTNGAIGQGATRSWSATARDWDISSWWAPSDVQLRVPDSAGDWTLVFSAPSGVALDVGTYEGAGYPFPPAAARPGLGVGGNGSGCGSSDSGGSFTVHDLRRDPHGAVLVFDASFSFLCATSGPAITGRIRYYASTRTAVTGPYWMRYGVEDAEPFQFEVTTFKGIKPRGTVTLAPAFGGPAWCTAQIVDGVGSCRLGPKQILPSQYDHVLRATFTPESAALDESVSRYLSVYVQHGLTKLAVDDVSRASVVTSQRFTYRAQLTAVATGEPLPGKRVTFEPSSIYGTTAPTGSCSATTDATGWATCWVPVESSAFAMQGFLAKFAGDEGYWPVGTYGRFTTP